MHNSWSRKSPRTKSARPSLRLLVNAGVAHAGHIPTSRPIRLVFSRPRHTCNKNIKSRDAVAGVNFQRQRYDANSSGRACSHRRVWLCCVHRCESFDKLDALPDPTDAFSMLESKLFEWKIPNLLTNTMKSKISWIIVGNKIRQIILKMDNFSFE